MALIRAIFNFEHHKFGWQELLYGTSPDINLVLTAAKVLVPDRTACLGTGPKLTYVKVSDDEFSGDSLLWKVPLGMQSVDPSVQHIADIATTDVDLRCEATALYRRNYSMSGQPDNVCIDGEYDPLPAWVGRLQTFRTSLKGGSWGMKVFNRANPRVNIFSMLWNEPLLKTAFVTTDPHNLVTGDLVKIGGRFNNRRMLGQYRVTVTAATQFTVPTPFYVPIYFGGAYVRKLSYIVVPFTSVEPMRCSRRARGGPSDRPRGRRRQR